jgi:acetyl-CoA carboxylase biotin carboxyl carrier protein
LDLDELKEILQMLDERDVTEFELEEEGRRLRVRRPGGAHPVAASAPPPIVIATTPVASAPPAATPSPASVTPATPSAAPGGEAASEPADGLLLVKSPIVGTFYRSPDPNSPPFVNVGDRVKVGQVLCIIEAMKLMNEIEAEAAGEVVKVHHENGQPVQYGEPLFSLRP